MQFFWLLPAMIVGIALAAPGKETAVDGLNERQVGSCTLPNGARRSRTAAHFCVHHSALFVSVTTSSPRHRDGEGGLERPNCGVISNHI